MPFKIEGIEFPDDASNADVEAVLLPRRVQQARERIAGHGVTFPDDASDEEIVALGNELESKQIRQTRALPRMAAQAVLGVTTSMPAGAVLDTVDFVTSALGGEERGLKKAVKPYLNFEDSQGSRENKDQFGEMVGGTIGRVPGLRRAAEAYGRADRAVTAALPQGLQNTVGHVNRLAGNILDAVPFYAGGKAAANARAATAARKESDAIRQTYTIPKDIAKVGQARATDIADTMGFKLGLEDVEQLDPTKKIGPVSGFFDAIGGQGKLRERQIHNRTQGENWLREEFGVAEDIPVDRPFTEKVIEDLLKPFNKAYDDVAKNVTDVRFSDEDLGSIFSADRSQSMLAAPAETQKAIDAITVRLRQGNVSGSELLDTIRELRDRSRQLSVNATSEQATAGAIRAQKSMIQMADVLEQRLLDAASATGGRDLAMDLLNSRQRQAQLHSLQRSTTANHLDYDKLRAELELNPQMTGVMRAVAEMATGSPKAFAGPAQLVSGEVQTFVRPLRAVGTKGVSEIPNAIAQWRAQVKADKPLMVLGPEGPLGAYYSNPGAVWNERESVRRLNQRLTPPPGITPELNPQESLRLELLTPEEQAARDFKMTSPPGQTPDVPPQRGFNFNESTAVEDAGGDFVGIRPSDTPERPPALPLAVSQAQGNIPTVSTPSRGTVLRRSVDAANRRADRLSLEGEMPQPEARRQVSFNDLTLEGGAPEGYLPQTLDDLLTDFTNRTERGWDPSADPRGATNAPPPKLRRGGDLALPEGRVDGVQAPVNVKWKPNDPAPWVLPVDPSNAEMMIRYLRGEL